MKLFFALMALLLPAAAQAATGVVVDNQVLVERLENTADGHSVVKREEPRVVTPGDRLVFVLRYRNQGAEPATSFVLTNPIPDAVVFAGSDDSSATVSVDGGSTWGTLNTLTVKQQDGTSRPAEVADVTHIRWSLPEQVPSGGAGELSFRGVVK